MSHWLLDALSHKADVPVLIAGGPRVGLGLWNSVPATVVVEGGLFVVAVWLYASQTQAKDRVGHWGFWSFVGLLVLIYTFDVFGPPPPSAKVVALAGSACLPLLLWTWWFDRHRAGEGRDKNVAPTGSGLV